MHGIRLQTPRSTSAKLEVQASSKNLESASHPKSWSKFLLEQESLHIKPQVSQNARVTQSAPKSSFAFPILFASLIKAGNTNFYSRPKAVFFASPIRCSGIIKNPERVIGRKKKIIYHLWESKSTLWQPECTGPCPHLTAGKLRHRWTQ